MAQARSRRRIGIDNGIAVKEKERSDTIRLSCIVQQCERS